MLIINIVLYGKKYRRPLRGELEINKTNILFDYGTHASIILNQYGKYEYTIYDLIGTNSDGSRYNTFDTIEEAKKHMIKTFGGKWKWSEKYMH